MTNSRWLYAAVLRGEDGAARDQSIWTLRPHRYEQLSDNWFDLLPGVAVRLEAAEPASINGAAFTAVTGVPGANSQMTYAET